MVEKERRAFNKRTGTSVETIPEFHCEECDRDVRVESNRDGGLQEIEVKGGRLHRCWVKATEVKTESLAVYAREGMLWCVVRWMKACRVRMVQVIPDMEMVIIESPDGFRRKLEENVWVEEFEEASGEIPRVFQDGMEVH